MSEPSIISTTQTVPGASFQVEVPLTPSYADPYVTVVQTSATVSIPLVPGPRTLTTAPRSVGFLGGSERRALNAALTLWSDYDPATKTLTLCGNELVDPDSTFLSLEPEGGPDQARIYRTHASAAADDPADAAPDLARAFQNTVRSANQAIIDTAIRQGYTVIERTPVPAISNEHAANLLLVYENGWFKEPFDPNKQYGPNARVHTIGSTWNGLITLDADENFANVIGSTDDPKIDGMSWIALWESEYGTATICTSYEYKGFSCTDDLIGGHSILGTKATEVKKGSDKVFIMPICKQHNGDDSVYMAAIKYTKGISLKNYLEGGLTVDAVMELLQNGTPMLGNDVQWPGPVPLAQR